MTGSSTLFVFKTIPPDDCVLNRDFTVIDFYFLSESKAFCQASTVEKAVFLLKAR